MHQSHNIPWDIISLNYTFVRKDKYHAQGCTALLPVKRTNGPQELKHFIRTFADTLRTFSATERQKYGTPAEIIQQQGKLFPDDLRAKYPDILNEENQRVEYWFDINIRLFSNRHRMRPTGTGSGEDVLRLLLHEKDVSPLLFLAQHPGIAESNINSIERLGYSNVTAAALGAYVFFNAADATGILETGEYAEADDYPRLIGDLAFSTDFQGQETIHQKFLQECGALVDGELQQYNPLVHGDYGRLKEYMKQLFALLYRFDVYYREKTGRDVVWEDQILGCVPLCTLYGVVKSPWR